MSEPRKCAICNWGAVRRCEICGKLICKFCIADDPRSAMCQICFQELGGDDYEEDHKARRRKRYTFNET